MKGHVIRNHLEFQTIQPSGNRLSIHISIGRIIQNENTHRRFNTVTPVNDSIS